MYKNIGERIRKMRKDAGLTQTELAERMGLKTKSGVCRLEKGDWHPSITVIEKIAKALNCSPIELVGWEINSGIHTEEIIPIFNGLTEEQKKQLIEYSRFLRTQNRS